ncbi:MAG TPA: MFS transporter [Acidimicrobiales bacterium]|nr:MFS transporter [Acidimicrobiales bacterium]
MRPLRATFVAFGFFWGTWAVVALDVQRFLDFSDAQLGLLLAATVFGGAIANGAGGVIAERHGTRAVLSSALVVWGAFLALLAAVTSSIVFCGVFLVTVSAGGLVDVAMNVAATAALGSTPGRLLRLHALFNGGALLGAGTSGVLLAHDVSYRVVWAGISAGAMVLALWCRASDMPAGERGEHHTIREGLAELRAEGLRVLAVVFAIGALVEGGVGTWGVLFLRAHLGLAVAAGAGAYVAGQALATTARSTLGWTAEHVGERRGAQLGLAVAGAGLLLEAVSTSSWPAAVGLGLAAVGSAVYWPLLLAFASRGGDRPGIVVGGLTAAGYVGFLAGPPVVGWIAQITDLRWGLGALGGAALIGATLRLRLPSAQLSDESSHPTGSST